MGSPVHNHRDVDGRGCGADRQRRSVDVHGSRLPGGEIANVRAWRGIFLRCKDDEVRREEDGRRMGNSVRQHGCRRNGYRSLQRLDRICTGRTIRIAMADGHQARSMLQDVHIEHHCHGQGRSDHRMQGVQWLRRRRNFLDRAGSFRGEEDAEISHCSKRSRTLCGCHRRMHRALNLAIGDVDSRCCCGRDARDRPRRVGATTLVPSRRPRGTVAAGAALGGDARSAFHRC